MGLQALRASLTQSKGWTWDGKVEMRTIPLGKVAGAVESCVEWIADYDPEYPHLIEWNGKLSYSKPPAAVIYTDACEWQRGLWVEADEEWPAIDEAWPFVEGEIWEHITLQETAAAADGIVETVLRRGYRNCTLAARIDATAALKYIACLGGRRAMFTLRVKSMQRLLREHHIQVVAAHVKGEENPADAPSRRILQMGEFMLCRPCFEMMEQRWGPFGLDACAAEWNHQLPRYLSRQKGDSKACGHDVLAFPIQHEKQVIYIYPPAHKRLVMEILQRVSAARAEAVIVLPAWKTMEVVKALKMAVDDPVMIESDAELLQQPHAYRVHLQHHAPTQWWLQRRWKVWLGIRLSGKSENAGAWHRQWQQTAAKCTRKDEMASILRSRSRSWWPLSENCTETRQFVSQTLSLQTW